MITCKDWMIYILEHNLVDKPIYDNGRLLGFMDTMEAAVKFEVGESTIRSWIQLGMLDSFRIDNKVYIPAWAEHPRKKGVE